MPSRSKSPSRRTAPRRAPVAPAPASPSPQQKTKTKTKTNNAANQQQTPQTQQQQQRRRWQLHVPRWALLAAAAALALGGGLRAYRVAHPYCDGAEVLRRYSAGGGVFSGGHGGSSSSSSSSSSAGAGGGGSGGGAGGPARVVVTGANSGVGFETARLLALGGARVTLGCRSAARCQAAADAIDGDCADACADWRDAAGFGGGGGGPGGGGVTGPYGECGGGAFVGEPLDLGDLRSVGTFARAVLRGGSGGDASRAAVPLRALVLNAGIFPSALGPVAASAGAGAAAAAAAGLESSFAVNHLGHFHLANLLMPALEAAAPGSDGDGGGASSGGDGGGGDGSNSDSNSTAAVVGGGGRIVIVSSEEGHRYFSRLGHPDDLPLPLAGGSGGSGWWWGGFKAYGLSKLANVLHAQVRRLLAAD
jgi:NAD(P)-dependent dehydrogenase (short-subunit alcohol dehydrogenase family)